MKTEKYMTWTIVLWIALGQIRPSAISAFVHSIEYVKYGFDPSMTINSQGHIHLSYYSSNLDYGRWDGISWSFEDVDPDSTSPRGQDSSIFADTHGRARGTLPFGLLDLEPQTRHSKRSAAEGAIMKIVTASEVISVLSS